MKEATANIATPTVQKKAVPFFQRSAEDTKEDSAFFSNVQTKLNVGAKDDPMEKEADSMADKVVSQSTPDQGANQAAGMGSVQTQPDALHAKACEPCSPTANIQARFESDQEDKLQKKEEDQSNAPADKNPVAADANTNGSVQRSSREVEDQDKIFRDPDPAVAGMSKRDAVIAMAKTMLGKIKAKQPGTGGERFGATELWEIFKLAAPGVWTEEQIKTFGQPFPHWCGIFTVWAHKKAGVDLGNWQMGKGVSAFNTLKETASPEPGDIGYIHQPYQHHALITKVGSNIESIDGNSGLFSEVVENTRPRSAYTTFYTGHSGSGSPTVSPKKEDAVQAKGDGTSSAPSTVESGIASTKGRGESLSPSIQSEMQSGLGGDFSNVKIHTDSQAAQMNKDLKAQAFAHGGDVYFNENKFNPGTSSGKHLLAHELTHTMQQGAAPSIQNKVSKKQIQKKKSDSAPVIQKANEPQTPTDPPDPPSPPAKDATPADAAKIAAAVSQKTVDPILDTGRIEVKGTKFELTLKNFPLKEYASDKDAEGKDLTNVEMPIPGTRKTQQAKKWKEEMEKPIEASVRKNILNNNKELEAKPELELALTNESKEGREKTKFFGDFQALMKEILVPFWTKKGAPQIHQIEHKVDWQILGNDKCDVFDNFLLLDMGTNVRLGREVSADIKARVKKVLDFYINTLKIDNVTPDTYTARRDYKVWIQNFIKSKTKTKSIIEPKELKVEAGEENPIKSKNITIKEANRPEGHFIFKTSKTGAGAVIPFKFKNKKNNLEFNGKKVKGADKFELEEVLLTKLVRDEKQVVTGTKTIPLGWKKEKDNYFKLNEEGYAYSIKNQLKLKDLSPVTLDGDPTLDVHEGVSAKGKVESDVPFLKDAFIEFGIIRGDYFVSATISPGFLKKNKKIPKPFEVEYGSITIEANSDDGLKVSGEVSFGIEKLGKGFVNAGLGGKGFEAEGKFTFDKSIFDGTIGFTYANKKWTISGDAKVSGKKIKAIKSGSVHFEYKDEVLKASGTVELTVPGISSVKIDTEVGKDGHFVIEAVVELGTIPRIKGGKGTLKISKGAAAPPPDGQGGNGPTAPDDWDLTITGKVMPDLNYAGLSVKTVDIYYGNGAYDFAFEATYDRNKIHGDFKLGVTNRAGDDSKGGKPTGEATKEMIFYGIAELDIEITEELKGKLKCVLKKDGDITVDGDIILDKDKPFLPVQQVDKTLFQADKNIPMGSCVVVTLSLHIGGSVKIYATFDPLTMLHDSKVHIGNLSLKNYTNPEITSNIMLASTFKAGVKLALELGLDASLLGVVHAQINGVGTLDFMAIDAKALGTLNIGWSPGGGFKINEASVEVDMKSELNAELSAEAKVFIDLWLTTIEVWKHKWPVGAKTLPLDFFPTKKKLLKFPVQGDKKLADPGLKENVADVEKSGSKDKVEENAQGKIGDKEGKNLEGNTAVNKQDDANKLVLDKILEEFQNPYRFEFKQSSNFLPTRYGLYEYLKSKVGKDKIDLTYIDAEIYRCEHEEYERYLGYAAGDMGIGDEGKSIAIEDFITDHPTLTGSEKETLRNLKPVKKAAASQTSLKDRGKQIPKKTAPQQPNAKTKVQKKTKDAGSKKSNAAKKIGANGVLSNDVTMNADDHVDVYGSTFLPDMEQPFANGSDSGNDLDVSAALPNMRNFDDANDLSDDNNKSIDMRPYTRTRRPLQQRADEKSKSPFFSGPEKKEKNGSSFFQAKLSVGEASDPMEKEADHVADAVTGKGGAPKEDRKEDIAKGAGVGKPEQEANKGKTPGADKLPMEEKKGAMQEEKKDKKSLQKKGKEEEKEEESKTVVKKKANNAPAAATAAKHNGVEAAITDKNGKGSSIPGNTLDDMQGAFGKDFSDVRIHNDSEAAALNEELDAHAFTTGKDIYFNSGKFDPESESGKHLLAHELTHVVQQNQDTIRRDPKSEKEEKNRAQKVRDDYNKALHAKTVRWEDVAFHFNAFNEPEQRQKMTQLNGQQLFLLHQAAIWGAGLGPYSAAATITTPVPDMPSSTAAAIETQMIHWRYQEAIDLTVEDLDKRGVINRSLLTAGRMKYLEKSDLRGEGRVLAPGFDPATGKAKAADANIGSDAFSVSAGLPLLYSTIIHEFQHVEQMQKPGDSKALIPDQGNDDQTHVQQEVEAYATELIRAKESGMYNIPDQIRDTWSRLHNKWQDLTDDTKKRQVNDLYKKAHEVAQQALGKSDHLIFTPMKP